MVLTLPAYPPRSVARHCLPPPPPSGLLLLSWHYPPRSVAVVLTLSSQECCYGSDTILPGVLLQFWHYPPRSVATVLTWGTGPHTTSWSWRHHTLGLPWPTTRPTGPWGRITSVTTGTAMMPAASGRPRSHTATSSTNSGRSGSVGPTCHSDSVSDVLENMKIYVLQILLWEPLFDLQENICFCIVTTAIGFHLTLYSANTSFSC